MAVEEIEIELAIRGAGCSNGETWRLTSDLPAPIIPAQFAVTAGAETMSRADPTGYYAALGISPGASASEIRSAYRRLAKECHPDTKGPHASAIRFREITEVYETLNDVNRRAAYDNSGSRPTSDERTEITPIVCSRCSKIAVQPRYVVFWTVASAILVTWRTPTQGIFCSSCARSAGWRASLISAVAGWWGIPWGPLYTFPMILANAFGGDRRKDVEEDLLWHNAVAFTFEGKYQLAYALAREVRKSRDEELALKALRLIDVLEKEGVSQSTPKLKNAWRIQPNSTLLHASLAFVVPAGILWISSSPSNSSNPYTPSYDQVDYAPVPSAANAAAPPLEPPFTAEPVLIPTGEIRFVGSRARVAPLQIVTRPGASYFVKVVNVATGEGELFAYIRGREPFEVQMPIGTYEMRYAAGQTWYGEELLFGPQTSYSRADTSLQFTDDGYQYAGYTIELIMQVGGNLEVDRIAASEF